LASVALEVAVGKLVLDLFEDLHLLVQLLL
jgi:hypothetical protein